MDSNRIKRLATGAREALRNEVSARLDSVLGEGSRERLEAASQVRAIEADLREHGRDEVVDRAAYTWFNRLCALRFMDANGYTPTPVVTPRAGSTQPAMLADAAQGVFDPEYGVPQAARQRVAALLSGSIASANGAEEAYSLLLQAVCAHYAGPMGYLFAEDVASTLLMPQGLLAQGSILARIVEEMDEGACADVEVLGWLYQFYIAERKDEYFASGKKATAADIPAATQLFTPQWIVAYLAENSLGRLWMLNNPDSELADHMDYYVAPEGDEPHLDIASADEIRVLDPACGSGHILVYVFDLLFRMYEEEGWPTDDIPAMILENNLFGLEIDRRAAEIASFALEMKARQHDPRFFEKSIDANITVLEPIGFDPGDLTHVGLLRERTDLLDAFEHLDEIGSLYLPDAGDDVLVEQAIELTRAEGDLFEQDTLAKLHAMRGTLRTLSQRYPCVIANPPYMGSGNMNGWLSAWIKENYPDEKSDMCTCFINRGLCFAQEKGYASLVTMQSWMFLGSYEAMRRKLIEKKGIASMAHLGARAFDAIGGEVVQTVATVFTREKRTTEGAYFRLTGYGSSEGKRAALVEAIQNPDCGWFYRANAEDFKAIPGWPIAYWASRELFSTFKSGNTLADIACPRSGLTTGNNDLFIRRWWEPSICSVSTSGDNREEFKSHGYRWAPCNKGGDFRKWYGNRSLVVDWLDDGKRMKDAGLPSTTFRNPDYYFQEGLTWSSISSGLYHMRWSPAGSISERKGAMAFSDDRQKLLYALAAMNSSAVMSILRILAPTLDYSEGPISRVPIPTTIEDTRTGINRVASLNVSLSHDDYDSFETSWDFARHPLVHGTQLANAYTAWERDARARFDTLKANEEELNRVFASIYHMEGEVPIEVPEDKVSVRLADRAREARSLVSYGVGCMLGRYSTQVPGLVLADQGATVTDFLAKVPGATYVPDEDNVLPVLDAEWFDDDIVSGFRAWLAHAYGAETLEANVAWLEESLGKDLRSHFCRDFYADHLKVYQKRPIYWMFSSPKGAFRCLVYMHRYNEGTVGTILTSYLRPLEDKLRARLASLETAGASASDVRAAGKVRATIAELEQWEREVVYPLAHERVSIDLDDGVKVNYNKFPKALAKVTGLSEWK